MTVSIETLNKHSRKIAQRARKQAWKHSERYASLVNDYYVAMMLGFGNENKLPASPRIRILLLVELLSAEHLRYDDLFKLRVLYAIKRECRRAKMIKRTFNTEKGK